MKTILIPTDLSTESLNLIKNSILNFPNQKINIVLGIGRKTVIGDFEPMDFLGGRNYKAPVSREFASHKNKLYLEHKNQISKIRVEVFTGANKYAFTNFLAANQITDGLMPKTPFNNFTTKNYFDLSQLMRSNMEELVFVDNQVQEPLRKEFNFKVTSILDRINL